MALELMKIREIARTPTMGVTDAENDHDLVSSHACSRPNDAGRADLQLAGPIGRHRGVRHLLQLQKGGPEDYEDAYGSPFWSTN